MKQTEQVLGCDSANSFGDTIAKRIISHLDLRVAGDVSDIYQSIHEVVAEGSARGDDHITVGVISFSVQKIIGIEAEDTRADGKQLEVVERRLPTGSRSYSTVPFFPTGSPVTVSLVK